MTPTFAQQLSVGRGLAHIFAVAAVATAIFMLFTANELGPFGPLVIAEAFYLLVFATALEAALLAMRAWHFVSTAMQGRRAVRASADQRGVLG